MATGQTFLRRLHAIVHGSVQGVNFRAFTRRKALEQGLTGWVRNLHDGTVETVAEGSQEALEIFEEFLHTGSPSAAVIRVTAEWSDATEEFTDFQVRYF
jgi:acylphosphatase